MLIEGELARQIHRHGSEFSGRSRVSSEIRLRHAVEIDGNKLTIAFGMRRVATRRLKKRAPHMPRLANTFWQLELSLALFCCRHV
jgi:hypothetical protein